MAKILSNMLTISIAHGFSFNIGNNVFEWRDTPLADSEFPAIIIRDPTEGMIDEDENLHQLDLEVILIPAPGDDSPESLRNKKQDVLNAFKLIENETYVSGAQYIGCENAVDHEKKKFASSLMRFQVIYPTERWGL
jgi:hypothetical protein